ncbi:recombinase family protein [Amycolatopsis sp. CA-126428]|uniref:recombinase family protein n=1 Tax=Amycolatopsis sp. CA-126428 TaxID=2073158 RepID=UPI0011B02874|nr:recombinase family protein [Amycolatopsis sp. CA-126428]
MSDTGSAAVIDRPATAPRAYGYMRVPSDVPDDKVRKLENQVVAYAENCGLRFVGFFFEFHCGSREAFDDLVAELVRADVHHVVVPSLRHLAHNRLLQERMLDHLTFTARAQVLAMRLKTAIE